MNELKTINSPKLLIVEGTHEIKFFETLLRVMNITNIQVYCINGDSFGPQIKGLKVVSGFSQLTSIGVLRDADNSFSSKFQSICGFLGAAGLPVPKHPNQVAALAGQPNTAVHIFPNNADAGCLEDLCLQSFNNNQFIQCVNGYLDCLNDIDVKYGSQHPHMSKAKVQVLLAREREGNVHMGTAAAKGVWPWDSPVFDQIKAFVAML